MRLRFWFTSMEVLLGNPMNYISLSGRSPSAARHVAQLLGFAALALAPFNLSGQTTPQPARVPAVPTPAEVSAPAVSAKTPATGGEAVQLRLP
jgi:hypothetical protein